MHVILIRLAMSCTWFWSGWQSHARSSGQVGKVGHVLPVRLALSCRCFWSGWQCRARASGQVEILGS